MTSIFLQMYLNFFFFFFFLGGGGGGGGGVNMYEKNILRKFVSLSASPLVIAGKILSPVI